MDDTASCSLGSANADHDSSRDSSIMESVSDDIRLQQMESDDSF